ncbi:GNAT family N-acetyltransferase [Kineosporia sp. J2-2]|uniref:GNAT family N-acetyltransferase n=1 Tax=Kineosporia corallincola TaxID=2835133 RepID=A0ABS5TLK9_9ACTN|nr:GNAT family N-acetyltransferase [Kineosporia corallincola]MBT0771728.1 GNAT family N-acetyltransferase [Kineosporia corallincola]
MADWSFRPATAEDVHRIADLKVLVIREHLERLRPWSEDSAREYLYVRYVPGNTRIIEVAGEFAGSVALRQEPDCRWIEQFYLYPRFQGRGIGGAVLGALLEECDADGQVARLDVLQRSPARRLYERHGFVLEHEDELDAFLIRQPRQGFSGVEEMRTLSAHSFTQTGSSSPAG